MIYIISAILIVGIFSFIFIADASPPTSGLWKLIGNDLTPANASWTCSICGGGDGEADGNNYPTSISFSGNTTKTLTLTRSGLSDLTASFTDIGVATSSIQIVSATSVNNSTDKGIEATCPAGKILTGGGASISLDTVNLTKSYPSSTGSWFAFGNEEGSVSGNWTITAYAICI